MTRQILVSCFQCASLHHCYEGTDGLERTKARKTAQQCLSWHKGLNNEVIQVFGRRRGMSRKNAQKLCLDGHARYIGPDLVMLSSQAREKTSVKEHCCKRNMGMSGGRLHSSK